jgi:hypothetical protein
MRAGRMRAAASNGSGHDSCTRLLRQAAPGVCKLAGLLLLLAQQRPDLRLRLRDLAQQALHLGFAAAAGQPRRRRG